VKQPTNAEDWRAFLEREANNIALLHLQWLRERIREADAYWAAKAAKESSIGDDKP